MSRAAARGSKLCRKVFAYSFLSVLVVQVLALSWYLFTYNQELRVQELAKYLGELARRLESLSDDDFLRFASLYQVADRRVWIEDESGAPVLGDPWPPMAKGARESLSYRRFDLGGGAAAILLKTPEPSILVRFPAERGGRSQAICFNWMKGQIVRFWSVYLQGILGLVILSLGLSLWAAKRVSKPLADLRDQVMVIASGDLGLRLSESGDDEIADVSAAVNHLTESLSNHMEGLKGLMANMSHEMRSSVSSLSMCLEILEEALARGDASLDPETRSLIARNLGQARLEAGLLESMVESGLLGRKLDLKHELAEPAPLDFSSLAREVAARHALRADLKRVALLSSITPDVWLSGDEALLDRLLSNIVDNALKYSPTGGEIRLTLSAGSDSAVIVCQNTHAPIEGELLKSLGKPYFRAEPGHVYGSGLGLYLVGKIAALHKGALTLSNCEIGLEARVELPIERPGEVF